MVLEGGLDTDMISGDLPGAEGFPRDATPPMIATFLVLATLAAGPEPKAEPVTRTGKAQLLSAALAEFGMKADPEPAGRQVVIRMDGGGIVPILSDEASRALFLDARLRDRKIAVQGRMFAGLPYFQVTSFKIEDAGEMRTPEYYCDVCTISVRYPQICPCCQGSMELRMKPEGR